MAIPFPFNARANESADGSRIVAVATKTVLLVDDDEHVRRSTFHALELLGYRVVEETSGVDALARVHIDPAIDILFTDVVMPRGMSGVTLARRARSLRPELAILLVSGHRRDAVGIEPDDGFAFLAKPYQLRDLASALQSIEQRCA